MKLKSVMGESFIREFKNPSFLPSQNASRETPCSVGGNSSWQEEDGFSRKEFSFSSRISLHSFCKYIFDLEQQNGIRISLSYEHDRDSVEIRVPHMMLGQKNFKPFFSEIDNVHYDVTSSFNNE